MPSLKLLLISLLLAACSSNSINHAYVHEIEQWHIDRTEELKKSGSWLSLAGLYWLEEGRNSFGSNPENSLVFPKKAPNQIGEFVVTGDSVFMTIEENITILENDKPINDLFLLADITGTPTILQHKTLFWKLLKRGDQFGIRIWDSEHEAIDAFTEIEHFPIDKNWRLEAIYTPYDSGKIVTFDNVLGMKLDEPMIGYLTFSIDKASYSLDVLDGGDGSLFLIFGDATTGETTYGGGRYLYIDKPTEGNLTFIDFNKTHNPPCAFTEYATCLLPPEQNYINVEVLAGEKNYGVH